MPDRLRIIVFADGEVGEKTVEFLIEDHQEDILYFLCVDKYSSVYRKLIEKKIPEKKILIQDNLTDPSVMNLLREGSPDYILLAWWPYIIKAPVISVPRIGVLNFHPSFLPYNRGKHYNFWTIVEDTPFGVSIHFVDESIDGGDIVFQKTVDKTWEDTGQTLYHKAQAAMFELFRESYPKLKENNYTRRKQVQGEGSFHWAKDLDPGSRIDLDRSYRARDLINILRARTFPPHPAAWFTEEGEKYEIRTTIVKVSNK